MTRMHLAVFCLLSLLSTKERWFINGADTLAAGSYASSSISKSFAVVHAMVAEVEAIVGDFNCSNNWSNELLSELFVMLSFSLLLLTSKLSNFLLSNRVRE